MSHSIGKLSSITFVGKLAGRGFEYALIILIGRELGPAALGVFTVAVVVLQLAGFVSMLGLNTAVQRFIPVFRRENATEKLTGLALLGIGSPLVVGSTFAIAIFYGLQWSNLFEAGSGNRVLHVLLLGIPLFAVFRIGEAATRGFKETKYAVYIRDIGQAGSAVVLVAIAIHLSGSIYWVAIAYLVSLLIGTLLSTSFLYSLGAFARIRSLRWNVSETYRYSLPVAFAALSGELLMYTDYLILGIFVPDGQVGQYRAAFSTAVLISFAMVSVSSIFPSIASELYHRNETERLDDMYTAITKWVTFVSLFAMLYFIVFSEELLSIFGREFRQGGFVLIVVVIGQGFNNFVGPAGYLLLMSDNERVEMVNNLVACLINIGLNIVLIARFGILGAAFATSFSIILQNAMRLLEVRLLLDIWPYSREYLRATVPLGIALVLMLVGSRMDAAPIWKLLLSGSVAGLAFLSTAVFLAYTEKDRLLVTSIK